jgi:type II secretory pathway component GspD/PulD (secretin)
MMILGRNRLWRLARIAVLLTLTSGNSLLAELSRAELKQRLVSLVVDKAAVVDVLKLLAAQNDLNLTAPATVDGEITVTLTNVSLVDALDVVTAAAAANWYIDGNIVVVKPLTKLDMREFENRLFRLQYISAQEAKKIVESVLPENGKVEVLSRAADETSRGWDEVLQIATYPERMTALADLIATIDRPRSLVEIEVKLIETALRDEQKLGVDFPDNLSVTLGNLDDESGVDGFATHPLDDGKWAWGRMTAAEVTFLLDYLIQEGRSKLISNPRVTTLSNQEAEIEVATTIPVETLNRFSEAGVIQDIVSFQDLDVSINLLVTPRVSRDSVITLDVSSSVEEITGYTGPPDNRRPITSRRSVTSSVTVKNGESLGLGGLMKEVEHKTVKKFPLLGSLPLLGRLFQHHSLNKENTELLILITPRILPSP